MKAFFYALVAVVLAIFVTSAPAGAMQQSQEMAAQAKHHAVAKHRVVHRTMHPKMTQGACRHKGHC